MRRILNLPIGFGIAILGATQGFAETGLDHLFGGWSLEGASEGTTNCPVKLGKDETIGGYTVTISPRCVKAYGWAGDITAWRVSPKQGVTLADATRHTVITFDKSDDGTYMGTAPDKETYVLYPDKRSKR